MLAVVETQMEPEHRPVLMHAGDGEGTAPYRPDVFATDVADVAREVPGLVDAAR